MLHTRAASPMTTARRRRTNPEAGDRRPTSPPPPASAAGTAARITSVVDGDTVKTSTRATIRLIGIDTPESGQCGAATATALMKKYVLDQPVTLTKGPTDRDRYGRYLRHV